MTNFETAKQIGLADMNETDDMGYPVYEYAGAFAIMNADTNEGREAYEEMRRGQCCGTVEKEIEVGGEKFLYTFDYGH